MKDGTASLNYEGQVRGKKGALNRRLCERYRDSSQRQTIMRDVTLVTLMLAAVTATAWGHGGRSSHARGVGVWMDDGNGKTVLADRLDSEEAAELARDMLDLLKLPAPPALIGRHHRHSKEHHSHASAPKWLRRVYDNLDEHGQATSALMDDVHRKTVTAADTIITFVNRDPPTGRPSKGSNKRLYFDVSDVPLDHTLLGAEIQVFRHQGYHLEELILHIYMVTDDIGTEQEVAEVTLPEHGWVNINVTTPVLSWLIFPETNHGLRLSVTLPGQRHERQFHEVGITGAHDEEEFRPFMVGFFALPGSHTTKSHIRTPRSVVTRSKARNYRDLADNKVGSDTLCRMKNLRVSFSDLGWEDWVIAPEGYDANYCEGHCLFPLHADMNATNHALVQTLVKVIDGVTDDHEVPPNACCAPIDLTTIPVLYYSYDNNVVLKKYPNMIVKTCGCH
ncbi:protein 60A-like isoform X2 [Macrobrachium nipponense]|uniref:protein 60A-like isoform X2 n=1 Tax=Macrobrachium nipponense TaxID=159736 RepID=UPI0030C7BCC3